MKPDNAQKTLLVVHTASLRKQFVLEKIKAMGLYVVCLHKEKVPWAMPFVDSWIIADTNNHKESLQAIEEYVQDNPNHHFDGVVTFWETCTQLTARIADIYDLIGIPYEIAKRVKNKYLFRDFCEEQGIPTPKHAMLHSEDDIEEVEKLVPYPLVLKPVYGQSSACVMRANNREELMENYEFFKKHVNSFSSSREWDSFDMLVEQYIDGSEVDIDLLVQNGEIKFYSISDNFEKSHGRFFLDRGQMMPSILPKSAQQDMRDMVEDAIKKLGITNGCIHFEAKSTSHGPFPVEVNMRLGGDYVYSYNKGVWGVDLVENPVKIALGDTINIELPQQPYKYIIGWDLQPPYSGTLTEQVISPDLSNQPFFEDMYLATKQGDEVMIPPDGYEDFGWITVSGASAEEAKDNLKIALSMMNFKVDPSGK